MNTYLNVYQDYLASIGLSAAEVTLGIIVFLVLTTFLALVISSQKSGQFATLKAKSTDDLSKMEQEVAAARQQLAQLNLQTRQNNESLRQQLKDLQDQAVLTLTENLQTLHDDALMEQTVSAFTGLAAKIGQLEHQNHSFKHQVDHLEVAKMATFDELNIAKHNESKLSGQLAHTNQQLALTSDKCQQLESELAAIRQQQLETGQKWQSLQAELIVSQNHIARLEEEAKQSAEQLNQSKEKTNHLQTELDSKTKQQQDNALSVAGLQAEQRVYEIDLAQLRQVHAQTLLELDSAKEQITELEQRVRSLASEPENTSQQPTDEEPRHIASAAGGAKQTGQWLSQFFKTVTTDLHLSKQPPGPGQTAAAAIDSDTLAEKDAMIENLKAELSAQQNHIARLEREIEAKQHQAQKAESGQGGLASKQDTQSSDASPKNLTQGWLAQIKSLPINEAIEKITRLPEGMKRQPVDPVKDKVEETTDKAKKIPDQFRSLFQKITPFRK